MKKQLKAEAEFISFFQEADQHYYVNGKSLISDEFYDQMKDDFFKKYPNSKYKSSIGASDLSNMYEKVQHEIKMGSQAKINTKEELEQWNDRLKDKISDFNFVFSDKLDGLSASLKFIAGNFVQGVSRGDGDIGDDLTNNISKIKNIPKKISSLGKIFVRGEILLSKKNFEKLNEILVARGDDEFANPRNAAAGIIRKLDGEFSEYLDFLAYDILDTTSLTNFKTEFEKLEQIKNHNFTTPRFSICNSISEIQTIWESYENGLRDNCEYELDGLIITINSLDQQKLLGIIDNRPRFSRAYKFTAQRVQTEILNIIWQAGRSGKITPVANLRPVKISGVTVSNVTLHNVSELRRKNVKIGSIVEIKRAGDVIPKLEQVFSSPNIDFSIPHNCPSCQSILTEEDTFLMCYNKDCPSKIFESLLFWIQTLEIKGFGVELVRQLFENNTIKKNADFYKLTIEQISSLEKRGEKSAKKVLDELNKKKKIPFKTFIKALGILNFSEKTAELLEPHYQNIDELYDATKEQLLAIHQIGEVAANAILTLKNRKDEIEDLQKYIEISYESIKVSEELNNQTFCFTGIRDKNAELIISQKGGKIIGSISKGLTALIAKDPSENSKKLDKARELNIPIITLEELWTKLN